MGSVFFWLTYILLWGLVVILFAALFFLYRHLGQGLLNSTEGRMRQGPEPGTRLPSIQLQALDGRVVRLGARLAQPVFVFFASPTCEPCRRALDALSAFARQYQTTLETVLVCGGTTKEEVTIFATALPDHVRVVPDTSWSLGTRLRVSSTPFAIIADRESMVRAKGMPDTLEAFEWFAEQLNLGSGKRQPA